LDIFSEPRFPVDGALSLPAMPGLLSVSTAREASAALLSVKVALLPILTAGAAALMLQFFRDTVPAMISVVSALTVRSGAVRFPSVTLCPAATPLIVI